MTPEADPDSLQASAQERFRALAEHPDLSALLQLDPGVSAPLRPTELGCGLAWGLSLVVLVLALTIGASMFFPPLAVLPFVLVGVLVIAGLQRLRQGQGARGPLERHPALILAQRVKLDGSGPASRTVHFLELQFSDGNRRELETPAEVAEELVSGAMGVAYLRHGRLIAFRALPV